MAAVTTLAREFEDALIEALQTRAEIPDSALADVQIRIGPPGDEAQAGARLYTGVAADNSANADERFAASGNVRKREELRLNCIVDVNVSGGGIEATTEARNTAHAIFAEVADELRIAANPGSNHILLLNGRAHMVRLDSWHERRGMQSNARWSQIPFLVVYEGDLPRT